MVFRDRVDAGCRLGAHLATLDLGDAVVLGLPRGGVAVAREVARALGAPLDVILVRKLGVPSQPELAMGAIGEDGVRFLNRRVLDQVAVSPDAVAGVEQRERAELDRRAERYRGSRRRVPLVGRTALIVDDGVATGSTARVACQVARAHGAARVVLAVPVAPPGVAREFADVADDVVVVEQPREFFAIGQFYADFTQCTDDDVVRILETGTAPDEAPPERDGEVEIDAAGVPLEGTLVVPPNARAVVVFAHGSGSSRRSPRNRYVAEVLHDARLGTLLFDLLTVEEADDRANVFDISLLGARLHAVTQWLRTSGTAGVLPVGYFGASTGAAAALWAATEPDADVYAVVSRGGRPDLAAGRLALVRAPTLLIVGGRDAAVLDLNRDAQAQMRAECRVVVVPGASHLFEEAGTLERAAAHARDWFVEHLR